MPYLLHHSVERSADRYPERPAFRFLEQELNHAQLEQRSAQLAHALLTHGIQRGDRVGIYLNKSLESALAIYGILRAGAVYVPLDPGSPAPRLAGIIQQCGIRCLITHDPKQREVSALLDVPGLSLDCIVGLSQAVGGVPAQLSWEDIRTLPSRVPTRVSLSELDLAYIMYTSGSTGTPKGIMHTHHSGLSYARLAADLYQVGPADRLSNHSPLHFDMSTFDYFCAPLTGACTVIIPEAYTKLPASLAELIETERLSFWYSVPYALIQLLDHGNLASRDMRSLRHVMFGGEPFPSKYLAALMQLWPQARFCNVYGPAEVNQCTYYFVPENWSPKATSTPIGRIWDNTEGLVVDEQDQVVPPGEAGELLIRSPTMMRGYWNRPELNRTAFFDRPVSGDVSDRFYRTGDLVRQDDDGELHFLGRSDRQVKIRGFRVELDEIEAALVSHPAVQEAAAYAPQGPDGLIRIEASVTLQPGQTFCSDELKRHTGQSVPVYAVPERLERLDGFPRTGSGKIDRRALRERAMADQQEQRPTA